MTIEEEIKQFAIQQGADLVGIASVADINKYAPPGHRPDDILTDAKSVITFAKRPIRGAWHSPNYRTPYYTQIWGILPGISNAVAEMIESKYGYYSLDMVPDIGLEAYPSFKLCAEMAGLGTRSMAASILLNSELGLLQLGICPTTMPLVADAPMKEPVCPHPSCVKLWEREKTTPCLATCPMCLSGELENGQIKWMKYDRRICSTRSEGESMNAFLKTLVEATNEPDAEVRRSMLLGDFPRRAIEMVGYGSFYAHCYECVRHCPICIQARTLKVKKPNPNIVTELINKEA